MPMPIFDDIGKKITQTTQSALKNTKDAADISRINMMVAEEQRLLGSFYVQLGKKYYDLYPESTDGNFAPLCASIKEATAKLVALEHEIQDIKGIKRCPRCEVEIPAATVFCGSCGYDTRNDPAFVDIPAPPKLCPGCNQEVAEFMSFCTACGQKI